MFPINLILSKSTTTIENKIGTIRVLTYLGATQCGYCLTSLYYVYNLFYTLQ